MYLQSLELQNFRNFPAHRFEFSPEINVLYGPNASGKTNILEAIYLLSNLRSFRTHRLRDMIRWDQPQAYIRGRVQSDIQKSSALEDENIPESREHKEGAGKSLAIKLESNSRTAFIQSKPCRSSREYLQVLPSTAFIPDDLELIKGLPAARRFFLDRGTFQYYPSYWALLTEYKKNLQQKNAALRQFKEDHGKSSESRAQSRSEKPWDIWNAQLQHVGSQVILHRLRFVQGLRNLLPDIYRQWLGNAEILDLGYHASIRLEFEKTVALLNDQKLSSASAQIARAYAQAIERNLERELRIGSTVIGPHRDDLKVLIRGRDVRAFGSQGQQRTAVLALKIAEVLLYFQQHQEYSVLVLDDVTSELDEKRAERLLRYLQHGMQVFISTTRKLELPIARSLACAHFNVSELQRTPGSRD